jgi:hypothetical protein
MTKNESSSYGLDWPEALHINALTGHAGFGVVTLRGRAAERLKGGVRLGLESLRGWWAR